MARYFRRLETGDRRALLVLIGAPMLVFVVPALLGYPLLTGDNVIQNYPLRALAGAMLRSGHLPLYDRFAWSGTPLLGGINAGAAFPAIVLFVVLPPLPAFVATEALAYAAAAVGLFVFLRCGGLRPLAAALGGAAFGLTGFVSSQAVHLDVVEAAASLSWLLVGIERAAHAERAARLGWSVLIAVAAGCLVLAGSPEVAFYAATGAAVYAGNLVLHAGPERARLAATLVVSGVAGLLLAGVQILPGSAAVAVSQRADVGTGFLSSGSIGGAQLLALLAPHLLGGGPVGLRNYVGGYNLAEIDAYPGMLALAGSASLVTRWRSPSAVKWRVWYLVGALGLLLALGSATPLPEVLVHLPVIGASRLPSRALVLYALASSVLLAHYVDGLLAGDPKSFDATDATSTLHRRRATRGARYAGAMPPVAVLVLVATVGLGGRDVARALAGGPIGAWSRLAVAPYLAITSLVGVAAALLAVRGPDLALRRRTWLLLSVAVADALLFTVDQSSLAPLYARALGQPTSLSRQLRRAIGPSGRFVVVDPPRAGGIALDEIGAPDLNALARVSSAQGYGSLVWRPYAQATGSHGQDVIAPRSVGGTALDSLDVRVLLVTRSSFLVPISSKPESAPDVTVELGAHRRIPVTRYFGGTVRIESVTLVLPKSTSAGVAGGVAAAVRLLSPTGRVESVRPLVTSVGRTGVAHFATASAAGLELQGPVATAVAHLRITVNTTAGRFSPSGALAAVATPPHWRLDGDLGPYAILRNTRAAPQLALVRPDGAMASGASLRVVSLGPWDTSEIVQINAPHAVDLVRSVADVPGWSADVVRPRGAQRVRIARDGVVQRVALPSGRFDVQFSYDAPGLDAGIATSAAGFGIVLVLAGLAWRSRRAVTRRSKSEGSR